MRDPKRIPKVLAVVQQAWEKNPELRLGQLLINLLEGYETGEDLFYMQDDVLVGLLALQYEVGMTLIKEWSGSLCPITPDSCWIDDKTGEHVDALHGTRTSTHPEGK